MCLWCEVGVSIQNECHRQSGYIRCARSFQQFSVEKKVQKTTHSYFAFAWRTISAQCLQMSWKCCDSKSFWYAKENWFSNIHITSIRNGLRARSLFLSHTRVQILKRAQRYSQYFMEHFEFLTRPLDFGSVARERKTNVARIYAIIAHGEWFK